MENKVLIFGHKNPDTDSICSSIVHEILDKKNGWNDTKAVRIGNVNKETQYVLNYLQMEIPELIEEVEEGQEVILVDHCNFDQSVDGIENAKIISVTDHHNIGNFRTSEPLYYNAKPYGCTSTILYEDFKKFNHKIDKKEAILMLSAIISDTLLLKSPTTTQYDKKALEELAKIAEIDVNEYGMEMLKAGTDVKEYSEEQLINLDAKDFNKGDVKYRVAQINIISIDDVLKREEEIKTVINKTIEENSLDLFVFAITDILNSNSEIIALGKKIDVIKPAFGKDLVNDRVFLPGVVSRKKQLVPDIDKNI